MENRLQDIKTRFAALKADNPNMRIRNAAEALNVSEADLLTTSLGDGVTRLTNQPADILSGVARLGEVMALTRNDACVHERKGVYDNPEFHLQGKMQIGLFVNPDIDLRLFMNHWAHVFAVSEDTKVGPRHSLQFFDKSGTAVHKIYLTNKSDEAAFKALVAQYTDDDQSSPLTLEAYPAKDQDRPDDEIDWPGFRKAWEELKDTHAFFPLLRKFGVGREQGFRRIGEDFAYEVENTGARLALEMARDRECDIMVFVGNRGCIQIHTGPVNKLVEQGPWFNVLDPKFNLHLNEQEIVRTWVTKKPTEDGIVTAVELFDADGEIIATLFGRRKPGQPELELWREIAADLPRKAVADAA
ncbi:hemin-degrading factor [Sneathiella chinensis]|uniref:Hemin-degrading factor n=1 Tax=Sneathiella chinensis TaxID=349750 RepID=A0ABQ5TYX5_9PROT|nr:ChuX/HutX family heme-like substrate-binding protein [Sneathiella chinensis]GLQ04784.1 hemin-degrading factor [Sneathiella chinensis]